MARFNRPLLIMSLVSAAALFALSGCSGASESKLEPTVTPPAIKKAGVLRVGADLSFPPFAGVDDGKQTGLDLDVAGALAGKLGLELVVVDVEPSKAATALADGTVDVVFSIPFSEAGLNNASLAGSYLTNGPAFFIATESTASVDASLTLDTLGSQKVGAQEGSSAYWTLASELGTGTLKPYATLRDAITAADEGDVQIVAGDAIVAAYIIRDFPNIHFAGQLVPAVPLGVAVAADNTALGNKVRDALDGLAADGVLDAIRNKWVGALPELKLGESVDASATP